MFESLYIKCFLYSPGTPCNGDDTSSKKNSGDQQAKELKTSNEELRTSNKRLRVSNEGLKTSNEGLIEINKELREARRAAFNLLEDTTLAHEVLRINEERIREIKEAYLAVVNGAPLKESLKILSQLVIKETAGNARTAFYIAGANGEYLVTVRGAGNMPEEYANEIDGFLSGEASLAGGLAAPTGLPIITTDVFEEPMWKPWVHVAGKYNYRGCWRSAYLQCISKPLDRPHLAIWPLLN